MFIATNYICIGIGVAMLDMIGDGKSVDDMYCVERIVITAFWPVYLYLTYRDRKWM